MKRSSVVLAAAVATVLAGTTYAQIPPSMPPGIQRHDLPSPSDPPATKAFKELHIKMVNRHTAFTGNADVDFVRIMIPHFQDAIDLAKIELSYGRDRELRAVVEKIRGDLERQMVQMEAWLKENSK